MMTTVRRVDEAGATLEVRFPYEPDLTNRLGRVPGATWDRPRGLWVVPSVSAGALHQAIDGAGFDWTPPADAPAPRPLRYLEAGPAGWVLTFPYDAAMVKAMRQVPGARYRDDPKRYELTPTAPTARKLAAFCAAYEVVVADEVAPQLAQLASEAEQLVSTSKALDADVQVDGLREGMTPFGYQRAAVKYGTHTRRTFFADPVGLGKTIEALLTLWLNRAFPAVIVSPMKVRTNWALEWLTWIGDGLKVAVIVPRSTSDRDKARLRARGIRVDVATATPGADVYVVAYDGVEEAAPSLIALAPRALVLDESQAVKTHTTKKICRECGADLAKGGKECQEGHDVRTVKGKPAKTEKVYKVTRVRACWDLSRAVPADGFVLCLSATPNKNHTEDFVAQLDIMGQLKAFGGKWAFLKRYCDAYRDKYGWHTEGSSNEMELNEKLRAVCYLRRDKAEVLPDLPPLQRNYLTVEVPESAMAEYRRAESDVAGFLAERAARLAAELGEDPRAAGWKARLKAEAAEHLVRINTLRRLAALAKIDVAAEWVTDFLEQTDRKLLIFAHHHDVIDALVARFQCASITGETTSAQAEEAKARFQTDPTCRLLVVGIMAGGTGLTLTAAEDELFLEQVWTPGDHDQAEGRAYGRVNDAHGVTATYMILFDSIDEDMRDLNRSKRADFEAAAEGKPKQEAAGQSSLGDVVVRIAERAREREQV
jgi:ribosomal protein L40E